jgi:hypothetical protein
MDEKLVKYFIEETNKKFEKLESKVDMLLEFKWRIVAGAMVISALITISLQIGAIVFSR